jgi:hypothetical protein
MGTLQRRSNEWIAGLLVLAPLCALAAGCNDGLSIRVAAAARINADEGGDGMVFLSPRSRADADLFAGHQSISGTRQGAKCIDPVGENWRTKVEVGRDPVINAMYHRISSQKDIDKLFEATVDADLNVTAPAITAGANIKQQLKNQVTETEKFIYYLFTIRGEFWVQYKGDVKLTQVAKKKLDDAQKRIDDILQADPNKTEDQIFADETLQSLITTFDHDCGREYMRGLRVSHNVYFMLKMSEADLKRVNGGSTEVTASAKAPIKGAMVDAKVSTAIKWNEVFKANQVRVDATWFSEGVRFRDADVDKFSLTGVLQLNDEGIRTIDSMARGLYQSLNNAIASHANPMTTVPSLGVLDAMRKGFYNVAQDYPARPMGNIKKYVLNYQRMLQVKMATLMNKIRAAEKVVATEWQNTPHADTSLMLYTYWDSTISGDYNTIKNHWAAQLEKIKPWKEGDTANSGTAFKKLGERRAKCADDLKIGKYENCLIDITATQDWRDFVAWLTAYKRSDRIAQLDILHHYKEEYNGSRTWSGTRDYCQGQGYRHATQDEGWYFAKLLRYNRQANQFPQDMCAWLATEGNVSCVAQCWKPGVPVEQQEWYGALNLARAITCVRGQEAADRRNLMKAIDPLNFDP